jgi:hypothetical protein
MHGRLHSERRSPAQEWDTATRRQFQEPEQATMRHSATTVERVGTRRVRPSGGCILVENNDDTWNLQGDTLSFTIPDSQSVFKHHAYREAEAWVTKNRERIKKGAFDRYLPSWLLQKSLSILCGFRGQVSSIPESPLHSCGAIASGRDSLPC